MTESHAAKKKEQTRDTRHVADEEDFERPDADAAAEGAPTYEHPAPSGADQSAPQNDVEHGYSQDSGYATSGGPSRGAAARQKRRPHRAS